MAKRTTRWWVVSVDGPGEFEPLIAETSLAAAKKRMSQLATGNPLVVWPGNADDPDLDEEPVYAVDSFGRQVPVETAVPPRGAATVVPSRSAATARAAVTGAQLAQDARDRGVREMLAAMARGYPPGFEENAAALLRLLLEAQEARYGVSLAFDPQMAWAMKNYGPDSDFLRDFLRRRP